MRQEQRQKRALQALVSSNTMTEAAELAGVSRRTLYSYLKDPWFRSELQKAYSAAVFQQVSDIQETKRRAEETLAELLNDPSPEVRLRAAKVILDHAGRREAVMLEQIEKIQDEDHLGIFSKFL